ncbi:MAG: acyltransferase family protein [Clostridia bacterium]|nr:acyltransferase family protein [Clostridia bacterium]
MDMAAGVTNRKNYLDQAKGIGIMLVVLAHLSNRLYVGNDLLAIWINSFHLPIFFIVSGYLFFLKGDAKRPFAELLKHKAAGLLYPYLAFSGVYIMIDLIYLSVTTHELPLKPAVSVLFRVFSGWGIGTLWFLPVLFLCELLFWIMKRPNSKWIVFILLLCCAVTGSFAGTYINAHFSEKGPMLQALIYRLGNLAARCLISVVFMGIGFFYATYEEWMMQKTTKVSRIIIGMILLTITVCMAGLHGEINLRIALIDHIWIYYLSGTMGTMALLFIFRELKGLKWLSFVGVNSLIIMATHEPFMVMDLIQWILMKAGIMNTVVAHSYLHVVIAFFLTMIVEIVLILLINRYVGFLLRVPIRRGSKQMEAKR